MGGDPDPDPHPHRPQRQAAVYEAHRALGLAALELAAALAPPPATADEAAGAAPLRRWLAGFALGQLEAAGACAGARRRGHGTEPALRAAWRGREDGLRRPTGGWGRERGAGGRGPPPVPALVPLALRLADRRDEAVVQLLGDAGDPAADPRRAALLRHVADRWRRSAAPVVVGPPPPLRGRPAAAAPADGTTA